MINTAMLLLKMAALVIHEAAAEIFHRPFQTYLKIFLVILWEAVRGEDLVRLLQEVRISDIT